MFENRNVKLDLFALALFALVIFLAVALFSYDPADPLDELVRPLNYLYQPDKLIFPLHDEVVNACGRWGALAADMLLTALGVGAYYLVVSLATLDLLLLRRHQIGAPVVRSVGWVASLVGLTTATSLVLPALTPGPVIGSGGYLGALGRGLLEMHFAFAGSLILAASLVLGGLLICTDYALLQIARTVVTATWYAVSRAFRLVMP